MGRIVHYSPAKVAGVELDLGDTAYSMHNCPECGLQFKDPFIPEDRLIACYEQASADNWEESPDPYARKFDVIERGINDHAQGPRILDIGCSNGALLEYMGQSWERFGIEPGQDAAQLAEQRGVHVVAPTLDEYQTEDKFDVILAIDVLEHLLDPSDFLHRVRSLLRPGGVFVGLTGDTGASSFRWHGSRYWYASLPEHQVFFSRSTVDYLASRHGMKLVRYETMSHARFNKIRVFRYWCRGVFWGLMFRLGLFKNSAPHLWIPAKDHMLFVLKAHQE